MSRRSEWRGVVDAHAPHGFAPWLRATRGCCGVYLLRASVSGVVGGLPATRGEILYVGESHRGALYGTLTKHFQTNGRRRYERERIEARIVLLDAHQAIAEEARQIHRHAPRDNARRPPLALWQPSAFLDETRIVVVVITENRR